MNSVFVEKLLVAAPQFQGAYEQHLAMNDELLPHVFMGDVTREVIAACHDRSELLRLKALMVFFEEQLKSGDAEARELIGASFCENVADDQRALKVLSPLMGPMLRQFVAKMQS
ncbi:MAG TPA: hypothetical protein VHU18_14795 [Rhizomicrobium sp.]|jgi:hypothetical protein|nr:hypothetical protein [Rhizomicrobium sp.]